MNQPLIEQIKCLSLAVFISATSAVMLVSIAGLNGAAIGEFII